MIRSFFRSMKTFQDLTAEFTVSVVAGAGAGQDRGFIKSVEKLATGRFKINLQEAAQRDLHPSRLISLTADRVPRVMAVTGDSVTVETYDLTGALADGDFTVTSIYSDSRRLY